MSDERAHCFPEIPKITRLPFFVSKKKNSGSPLFLATTLFIGKINNVRNSQNPVTDSVFSKIKKQIQYYIARQ